MELYQNQRVLLAAVCLPHSGLFLNQKFLYKCLKINFGGFIFEVSIFQSIPLSLLPCPIVT